MIDLIQNNPDLIKWVAIVSAFIFLGTLILVPYLIIRLPADYFNQDERGKTALSTQNPPLRFLLLILKNLAGYILILLGIVLIVLPGQGILTIIVGLILIDFPMKYRLERWLVGRKKVLSAMNWLRKRAHKRPLKLWFIDIFTVNFH